MATGLLGNTPVVGGLAKRETALSSFEVGGRSGLLDRPGFRTSPELFDRNRATANQAAIDAAKANERAKSEASRLAAESQAFVQNAQSRGTTSGTERDFGDGQSTAEPAPPNTGNISAAQGFMNAAAFSNPVTAAIAMGLALANKKSLSPVTAITDALSGPASGAGGTVGAGDVDADTAGAIGANSASGASPSGIGSPDTPSGPAGGTDSGSGQSTGTAGIGGSGGDVGAADADAGGDGGAGGGGGSASGGTAGGGSSGPGGPGSEGGPGTGGDAGGGAGSGDGGDSKIICTELFRQGLLPLQERMWSYRGTMTLCWPETVRGYHFWAIGVVRAMRRGKWRRFWAFMVRHRACEMAYRMGLRERPDHIGKAVILWFHPISFAIGMTLKLLDHVPDFGALYTDQYPRI